MLTQIRTHKTHQNTKSPHKSVISSLYLTFASDKIKTHVTCIVVAQVLVRTHLELARRGRARALTLWARLRGPNSAGVRGTDREPASVARGREDKPVRNSSKASVPTCSGCGMTP